VVPQWPKRFLRPGAPLSGASKLSIVALKQA
jgi:hypothetical protein